MEQFFITDLDGTLLNSTGYLSFESEQILQEIVNTSPHKLGFATARGWTSAAKVIQRIPWNFPVILNNGALIYDWQAQKVLKIKGIESGEVQKVLELALTKGVSPFIFTLNENFEEGIFYQSNPSRGLQYFMNLRPHDPRFIEVVDLAQEATAWDAQSLVLMFIDAYDILVPLKLQLQEQHGEELKCLLLQDQYIPNHFVLEVSSAKATKEKAIEYLQEQYNIKGENLHLFGDNLNDQGMLKLEAHTYAVGNAHPSILDLAQHKIATNDQDGVAQTIKHLVNQVL
ncbi:HAD-IIB family hydrolase [Myroides fluvii]|uniref:HAD-IIB family hydrolase n=1 Tax=Myroides fluvii TaxID=2572594 RepID=UPI00131EA79E|nr:HAD family hydrolase [Myroides fluvii]